jgi:hypothetical protein
MADAGSAALSDAGQGAALGSVVPGIGTAVGAIGGGLIGLLGGSGASDETAKATAAQQAAVQQWLQINVPDPAQLQVELQNYKVTGQLSPQMQQAYNQSPTGLKNMSVDQTGRTAETQALAQMQNIAQNGGMDAISRQQQAQAINTANANEAGQRSAIVQNFAARGMGGAGAEMAAQLQASQGDANQAAAGGLQAAAGAQGRALQAMQGASAAGSNLNASDYAQAAAAAQAQDAINRFNTANSQAVSNANVGANNAAQAATLANAQSVANANTGVGNEQEVYNKNVNQTIFGDQATKAKGVTGAETGASDQYNTNAENIGSQWSGIGQAVSQGAGALGNAFTGSKKTDDTSGSSTPGTDAGYGSSTTAVNPKGDPNNPSTWAEGGEVKKPKEPPNPIGYPEGASLAEGGEAEPSLYEQFAQLAKRHRKN